MRDDAGRSAVSPDGKQFAFVSGRKEAEMWVTNSDGQDAHHLADAGAGGRFLQLQWSPDGHRIALMKSVNDGAAQTISVESIDAVTGKTIPMFSSARLQSFCWTSDGGLYLALTEPPPNEHDTNLWRAEVSASGELKSPPTQVTKWAGFSFWDLSATADGARLAFVKSGSQADVYVGKLAPAAANLADVTRLTLNEHDDWPSAWTPDGAVLFYSNRNGHFDIFKERPGSNAPEELLAGPEDKLSPEVSADGKWLLFWQAAPAASARRLMKMALAAGTVSAVLEAPAGSGFHCARAKSFCFLAKTESLHKEVSFERFEVASGERSALTTVPWAGPGELLWNLNADGSLLALVDAQEKGATIRTIVLATDKSRDYELTDVTVTGIAGAAAGWLLTTSSLRGNELLYLDSVHHLRQLWSSSSPLSAPVVSNDGRRVALGLLSQYSNAWLLEQK